MNFCPDFPSNRMFHSKLPQKFLRIHLFNDLTNFSCWQINFPQSNIHFPRYKFYFPLNNCITLHSLNRYLLPIIFLILFWCDIILFLSIESMHLLGFLLFKGFDCHFDAFQVEYFKLILTFCKLFIVNQDDLNI